MKQPGLGLSGSVARAFQDSQITPLLALLGLLLGLFAVIITPKEEEPQIDVTFANVFVPFPGATPKEVEQLVAIPAEQKLAEVDGVEHVFSVSQPGLAILTVQFKVGVPRQEALVKLYNQVFSNQDWLPPGLGTLQPLIKPKGIDDVPILSLTLWSKDPTVTATDLRPVAHTLETELKRIPGTRDIYSVGAPEDQVVVSLVPDHLHAFGLDYHGVRDSLRQGNQRAAQAESVNDGTRFVIQAGSFLSTPQELAELVVGVRNGQPVRLEDVASVERGVADFTVAARHGFGASSSLFGQAERPALTIAIAKQPGQNAVQVAEQVHQRLDALRGVVIPDGIEVTVTRDYGLTAAEKSAKLILKLAFATAAVVLLVWFALGWREALIVGLAIAVTLAITLFASWAWGFTLNRVSLFALIFSIGILVDDAIVVVENIHRHRTLTGKSLREVIPGAVDEVGGATILATFTVIAALLPMAFVSGLMGPYMSPIPINASTGMLISLGVAFVITPWLAARLMRGDSSPHATEAGPEDRISATARAAVAYFVHPERGRARRHLLYLTCLLLITLAAALPVLRLVVLKMLPFDNKSEIQVVVDMPEDTPLEGTLQTLQALAGVVAGIEEVDSYQVYAGTAAPINFNGLVRQYYLRSAPWFGDIQVNLVARHERQRDSHAIAKSLRESLRTTAVAHGANVKVVEVPPGPPVQAPLVAEIYGFDESQRHLVASRIRQVLEQIDGLVDVDDSIESDVRRLVFEVDRSKAARLGIAYGTIVESLAALSAGEEVTYLRSDHSKYAVPVVLRVRDEFKASSERLLQIPVRSASGILYSLAEVVTVSESVQDKALLRKDLLPVVLVTGDMVGELDSPLYGMFDASARLEEMSLDLEQYFVRQPALDVRAALKWDGEWQVTYETFRDMGIAYGVGMILIYLLVVAQFRSYLIPLVIMAPIVLTVIGVMPGHALLGAPFTASSMIGMIALAGIIVRNSILLVDFANEEFARGLSFREAIVNSSAVRSRPILLTALAAVLGAFFILDDPIFNGLAISLVFGILVSSLLTLVVIPVLYFALYQGRRRHPGQPSGLPEDGPPGEAGKAVDGGRDR